MISLTELQQKVKKDLKINDLKLDVESLRIPSLHSKYLQLLTEHSLAYKKARNELSIIRRGFQIKNAIDWRKFESGM